MSHHGTILAHLIGGGFANRREDDAVGDLEQLRGKRTVNRVVTGIRIWATQPMDGQRA